MPHRGELAAKSSVAFEFQFHVSGEEAAAFERGADDLELEQRPLDLDLDLGHT